MNYHDIQILSKISVTAGLCKNPEGNITLHLYIHDHVPSSWDTKNWRKTLYFSIVFSPTIVGPFPLPRGFSLLGFSM